MSTLWIWALLAAVACVVGAFGVLAIEDVARAVRSNRRPLHGADLASPQRRR